jgi:hypothetical protein
MLLYSVFDSTYRVYTPMPEIGAHDEVVPPGDVYLDDFLAPGQEIPYHWDEMRAGRAEIFAIIDPVVPGATYHLIIVCHLAAPAVGGRPTSVSMMISGEWDTIENTIVPRNDLLYRAQNQTMRCRHLYGPPDLNVRPLIPVDEAHGARNWIYESNYWVPISQVLACIFRNPPVVL